MIKTLLIIDGKKICSTCGISRPIKFFNKDKRRKCGLSSDCKICKKKYARTPHGKLRNENRRLKYNYGITIVEYNKLFNEQQGCCAICGKHQSQLKRCLDVDHDHKTGRIRGLLCNYCNKILERHLNSNWLKNVGIVGRVDDYLRGRVENK